MSKGTRVLFVDDHEGVRLSITCLLEASGAAVTAVSSGFEALAAMDQARFDVVCTDLGLPGMDGGQLISVMQDRGITTPVVLISGAPPSRIQAALLGKPEPQAIIGKPAPFGELIATIERLAHLHQDSSRSVRVA